MGKLYPADKRRNSNYPLIDLILYFYYKITDSKTSLKRKKIIHIRAPVQGIKYLRVARSLVFLK